MDLKKINSLPDQNQQISNTNNINKQTNTNDSKEVKYENLDNSNQNTQNQDYIKILNENGLANNINKTV